MLNPFITHGGHMCIPQQTIDRLVRTYDPAMSEEQVRERIRARCSSSWAEFTVQTVEDYAVESFNQARQGLDLVLQIK